jgi:hypothetical protein
MVALKQLKSQQVSLQAFAPDVSSETAYVINRMMAKKPEERYQSYEDLVGHLSYARDKVMERARKPHQPKQRVVLETDETRKLSAIISLVLLGVVFLAGLGVYLMRDKLFPPAAAVEKGPVQLTPEEAQAQLLSGVATLAQGDSEGARIEFQRLATQAGCPQPQKSWAVLNSALASLVLGETNLALQSLTQLSEAGLYPTTKPEDQHLANFFVEVSRVISQNKPVPASIRSLYDARSEAFALLIFALWDWEAKAAFSDAGSLLKTFESRVSPDDWASKYKPLAEKYLADWKILEPLEKAFAKVDSPASASAFLAQIQRERSQVQTGARISDRLDVMERKAKARAAVP